MMYRTSVSFAGLALLWGPLACSLQDFEGFGRGGGGGSSGEGGSGGTDPIDVGGSGGGDAVGGSGGGGTSGQAGAAGQSGAAGSAGSGEQGLLEDPSFESGHAGWTGFGGSLIEDVTSNPHTGLRAIFSRNRAADWNGPSIRLEQIVEQGRNYTVTAWLRTDGDTYSGDDSATVSTKILCENLVPDAGLDISEQYTQRGTVALTGQWAQVQGTFGVPECYNLSELVLYFEGPPPDVGFYLDDVVLLPLE